MPTRLLQGPPLLLQRPTVVAGKKKQLQFLSHSTLARAATSLASLASLIRVRSLEDPGGARRTSITRGNSSASGVRRTQEGSGGPRRGQEDQWTHGIWRLTRSETQTRATLIRVRSQADPGGARRTQEESGGNNLKDEGIVLTKCLH